MEVSRQLQLLQTNSDTVQQSNDALLSSNQTLEAAYNNLKDGMAKIDKYQTMVMALKAQYANLSVELGRVCDYLSDSTAESAPALAQSIRGMHTQHERMASLINKLELLVTRTNTRHVAEASLACSCTHQTMNSKIEGLDKRISEVRVMFTMVQNRFIMDIRLNLAAF